MVITNKDNFKDYLYTIPNILFSKSFVISSERIRISQSQNHKVYNNYNHTNHQPSLPDLTNTTRCTTTNLIESFL